MGPPYSHRIPRVRWYSGYARPSFRFTYRTLTFFGWLSHVIRLQIEVPRYVRTPKVLLPLVWPLPLSLATTRGISIDFSSSPYLDVSVREVPYVYLCIQYTFHDSSPWGFPHSEIRGYIAYLQLPEAYRSLSRPSSAPDAKAFALCSFSLELSLMNLANSSYLVLLNCLSFLNKFDWLLWKGFSLLTLTFPPSWNCIFYPIWKDLY